MNRLIVIDIESKESVNEHTMNDFIIEDIYVIPKYVVKGWKLKNQAREEYIYECDFQSFKIFYKWLELQKALNVKQWDSLFE